MKKILFGVAALGLLGLAGVGVGLRTESFVETEAATSSNYEIEIRFSRPTEWTAADVKLHTWGGGIDKVYDMSYLWPNIYGQAVYSWNPSETELLGENIQFMVNNYANETSTIAAPSSAGIYNYFKEGAGWSFNKVDKMRIYFYDYDAKFSASDKVYAHVTRNLATKLKFDDGVGIEMTPMSELTGNNLVYYADVSNAIDRVTFTDGASVSTGETTGSTGDYCYIYSPDSDIESNWWDNINYVLAHNWAQNLMLFKTVSPDNTDDTGTCETKYATAKAVYNTFKDQRDGVLSQISSGFSAALTRLSAWAEHNGETFTVTDGVGTFSNARNVNFYDTVSNDNNAATIAMVITVATIVGAGALFLARKRRAE